ncbi:sugar 3,4-ketoisomerase [Spirochaeta cellobiosiphila]|uniref:sugar 3,4-ketoisomerase n=1 Tax=Spirochaeta cellobiosiphila TaxID=504483 RepID=UPI0003F802D8|nr:FdtA/QdtA family cupin domain-containing protein [Spirochaeta cellobiosiphila]
MDGVQEVSFKEFADETGALLPIEAIKDVPFEIKRIFFIYDVAIGETRAHHANIYSSLLLVPLKGSCKVTVNNGFEECLFDLNDRRKGILCKTNTWKVLSDFSEDCVLLVMSDYPYDLNDYIRDFDEFIAKVKK